MALIETATKILKTGHMCDHCLGRQFAQLLSGFTNAERGAAIRLFLAMAIDSGEKFPTGLPGFMSNFFGVKFRQQKIKIPRPKPCRVCGGLFQDLPALEEKISKAIKGIEFSNFHLGIILSKRLLEAEERLWELAGIEWCESIKSELSRELGKTVSEKLKKEVEMAAPEVVVVLDLEKNIVKMTINPLFVYGKYKKLAEMPQTKYFCRVCRGKGCKECDWTGKAWPSSIEERIGKTFLAATKGKAAIMHAAGREDIDVRCLAWREFVLEIKEPKKRSLDLKKIQAAINKKNTGKIAVGGLRPSSKEEMRAVKEKRIDKTYRVTIELAKPIKKSEFLRVQKKLRGLVGLIRQRTPLRVVHRRADTLRKREVKAIKAKQTSSKKMRLEITAETGLYVKELVTGDGGRTRPSMAELLEMPVKVKKVEIIRIG